MRHESPHDAHLEVVVEDRQGRLEMLETRAVAETQQAIDLWHVQLQASRQLCLAHAGIPHRHSTATKTPPRARRSRGFTTAGITCGNRPWQASRRIRSSGRRCAP